MILPAGRFAMYSSGFLLSGMASLRQPPRRLISGGVVESKVAKFLLIP